VTRTFSREAKEIAGMIEEMMNIWAVEKTVR
jgi:hypothetical protein